VGLKPLTLPQKAGTATSNAGIAGFKYAGTVGLKNTSKNPGTASLRNAGTATSKHCTTDLKYAGTVGLNSWRCWPQKRWHSWPQKTLVLLASKTLALRARWASERWHCRSQNAGTATSNAGATGLKEWWWRPRKAGPQVLRPQNADTANSDKGRILKLHHQSTGTMGLKLLALRIMKRGSQMRTPGLCRPPNAERWLYELLFLAQTSAVHEKEIHCL
jgi:hypothetical protein